MSLYHDILIFSIVRLSSLIPFNFPGIQSINEEIKRLLFSEMACANNRGERLIILKNAKYIIIRVTEN